MDKPNTKEFQKILNVHCKQNLLDGRMNFHMYQMALTLEDTMKQDFTFDRNCIYRFIQLSHHCGERDLNYKIIILSMVRGTLIPKEDIKILFLLPISIQ